MTTSRKWALALVVAIALFLTGQTARAGLIGTQATGSLQFGGGGTNFFDPANGLVPTGFLNKT